MFATILLGAFFTANGDSSMDESLEQRRDSSSRQADLGLLIAGFRLRLADADLIPEAISRRGLQSFIH